MLDLPRDHRRPAEQSYAAAIATADLSVATDTGIRELASELGATPSTVVLAALGELVRRVTEQDEVVIGVPVADRRHAAFADLVGCFVDIVPLRLGRTDDRTFAELVTACRGELFDALAHPDAPLPQVVDALSLPRDPSRSALVQVLFNNVTTSTLELPGIQAEELPAGLPGTPFDLTTHLVARDGRLRLDVVYHPDLHTAQRIDALLAALVQLLDTAVVHPDRSIGRSTMSRSDVGG